MSDPGKAVFLSYASQDAEAAKRICEALQAAGLEVWFDQSELRGGDAWDAMIRKRIKECALFVPLITPTTNARTEGYFRLEWKLAVDRSHLMADDAPFLFPIVLGDVNDATARVPDKFREVQWTRLRLDETPAELAARMARLLAGDVAGVADPGPGSPGPAARRRHIDKSGLERRWWLIFPIMGMSVPIIAVLKKSFHDGKPPVVSSAESSSDFPPPAPGASHGPPAVAPPPAPPAAARDWPKNPELKQAFAIVAGLDATVESGRLAEDMVNAVLKQRPTDPEATVVYAMLNNYFLNRGYDSSEERFVLARRFAERALQLAPEEPEALAAMAQFLTFRGSDYPRAEALIRQAMALAPAEPRFGRILSYNVYRMTDPAKALEQAKANVARFPGDALTHYDLALICRGTGELALMEQSLDRALALAPIGSAMIWKGWLAAWVHGDLPGFKAWLDRISGNFRYNERTVYMRYLYASLSGDTAYGLGAVRSYTGTWLSDFYYTGPRALLVADLLALEGKADLAREEYARALVEIEQVARRNPENVAWERAKFWTLLGAGRTDEARVAAKRIVERLARPYRPVIMLWWHDPIPAQLLAGDRADAVALIREAARTPVVRAQIRTALKIDRRMTPFRDDPEISALLAEPGVK